MGVCVFHRMTSCHSKQRSRLYISRSTGLCIFSWWMCCSTKPSSPLTKSMPPGPLMRKSSSGSTGLFTSTLERRNAHRSKSSFKKFHVYVLLWQSRSSASYCENKMTVISLSIFSWVLFCRHWNFRLKCCIDKAACKMWLCLKRDKKCFVIYSHCFF